MHKSHGRRRQTGVEEAGDPDGDVLVCHLRQWSRSPSEEDILAQDALVGGPRRRLRMTLGWHPPRGEVPYLDLPRARVNIGACPDGRVDGSQVVVCEVLLCERFRLLPAARIPPPRRQRSFPSCSMLDIVVSPTWRQELGDAREGIGSTRSE